MAKYRNKLTGEIQEIGSPDLNPDLVRNMTPVSDTEKVGTISSDALSPTKSLSVPDFSVPSYLNLGSIQDLVTANNLQTPTEKGRTDAVSRLRELTASLGGKAQETEMARLQAGVPNIEAQLNSASNEFRRIVAEQQALQQEATAIPLQIQQEFAGRGATAGGVAPIQTGRLRENAIKQASVTSRGLLQASVVAGLRDDIALSERLVDRAIQAKYAPVEAEINGLKEFLTLNYQDLTREDKKKADNLNILLGERTRQLSEQKDNDKIIQGFVAEAIKTSQKNGVQVPNLILQRAGEMSDPIQALQLLNPYLEDAIGKESALLDIQKKRAEINEINKKAKEVGVSGITNPNVSKYATAISVVLGSSKLTKDQKNDFINSINSGLDPETVLKNKAKDIMGQTQATSLSKYETAKEQLINIDGLLKSYYANGGKTGIFTGNYEKTLNKLGELKDPKLVEIAVNIASALQIYRNAVSGTAYSVQEGKDIASIFPGINKSEGLNTAILQGRQNAFDTTIDSEYRNAIGSAYDIVKAKNLDPNASFRSQLKAGEILVNRNGKATAIYPNELLPTDIKL